MATGYTTIGHATWSEWRTNTLGQAYDVDGFYGCQCLTAGHFVSMQDGSYKDVKDIKEGEIVSTGNKVILNKKRLSKVYKVYTGIGNFKVSEDHRFILKDGKECYLKDILHKELNIDDIDIKKKYNLTQDELRFLGFYLGDGTKKYRHKNSTVPQIFVTIGTKEKEDYLLSLGFNYHISLHSNGKARVFSIINKEHKTLVDVINNLNGKNLPRLFNAEQFSYIVEGYIKADGYRKRKQYVCTSVDKPLLLAIQYGCFLNGWQAKLSDPLIRDETNLCKHPKPIYRLSINMYRQPSYKVRKVEYVGKEYVYLINLDGTHIYFGDNVLHHNCWDYAAEFWYNVGFPQNYPLTGPNQAAYECWTVNRNNNVAYNGTTYFDLIDNLSDVQEGDVLVWDATVSVPAGHIAFADEDYDGSGYIWVLGQNQGGTPDPSGGTPVTRNHLGTSNFLGAFRYKPWHETPPPPTPTTTRFPWVLYARNMRKRRQ